MANSQPKQPWFVILQQDELEKMTTPAQVLVYMAIKSYTANGVKEIGLSLRDIQKRCHFTIGWMKPVIQELIDLGLVFRVGTLKRFGGQVQVFRVGTRSISRLGVPSVAKGVPSVAKSSLTYKVIKVNTRTNVREKQPLREKSTNPKSLVKPSPYKLDHKVGKNIPREKTDNFGVASKNLLRYLYSKTGVKQVLIAKQMAAMKRIFKAGFSEEDVCWAIDKLWGDSFWRDRGFDFMTIAGQISKLKMAKPKTLEEQGYTHFKAKGGEK